MTDKQIIIDGIDVSGCEYYLDEKCRCMDTSIMQDFYSCPQCKDNPNCYYKQLKRLENEYEGFAVKYTDMEIALHNKEQECDRLRFPMKDSNYAILTKEEFEKYDQLKASLDEKNKFLEQLGISASGEFHRIKYYIDKLVAENEELKNRSCAWKSLEGILCPEAQEQLDQLKQTLDEIKEIAESCGWNFGSEILYKRIEYILQKISEVENENK